MVAVISSAIPVVQHKTASASLSFVNIVLLLAAVLIVVVVTVACAKTRRLAQELEQASRAKLEFLTTMSHELRTPLNAIAGYTDLLLLGLRGPVTEEQREDLTRIQRNQRQLLALINDVLNFAKLDIGAVYYSIESVRIASTLQSAFLFIEPQIMEKQIEYTSQAIGESVCVYADEEKLYQIFVNLISNAVKFTPTGGKINVTCIQNDQKVFVTVSDTGIGIPVHKLRDIFDPFVQVDTSLTREHSGVGLGLSISRNLAVGMHGDIVAESQVGRGSTFTVMLPVAPACSPIRSPAHSLTHSPTR